MLNALKSNKNPSNHTALLVQTWMAWNGYYTGYLIILKDTFLQPTIKPAAMYLTVRERQLKWVRTPAYPAVKSRLIYYTGGFIVKLQKSHFAQFLSGLCISDT